MSTGKYASASCSQTHKKNTRAGESGGNVKRGVDASKTSGATRRNKINPDGAKKSIG